MLEESDYFLSQDGIRLYYRSWAPVKPERILCVVHGLGEHSGRYARLADYLTRKRIAVFALDMHGHGISGGKKGHIKNYELLLSDVEELLKTARSEYTDLPMYLMGHSMGGNVVANYVLKMNTGELDGYILSSPWLRLVFDPPRWKLKFGKFFNRFWPSFTQPNNLDTKYLSKDPAIVKAYEEDPLVHGHISAGMFACITGAGEKALNTGKKASLPGLVYHGNMDRIIDWKSSKELAAKLGAEWHELNEVYHEPHNDLEKDLVYELLAKWICQPSVKPS